MLVLKGSNHSFTSSLEADKDHRVVNASCEGECWNIQLDKPYQVYTSSTQNGKRQGKQWRTFQKSLFEDYIWLTYCSTHNVTYCFYCRKANYKDVSHLVRKLKMRLSPKALITEKKPKKNSKNMKKASVIKKHL